MENSTKRLIEVASGKVKAELVIKDARYLNVYTGEILSGDIALDGGLIAGIGDYEGERTYYTDGLIVPGFIDGHIHIESSMVTPERFAEEALRRGTTTAICDPHEIANVAGVTGIEFMLDSVKASKIDFKLMLPSCVPATEADENYAKLTSKELTPLYAHDEVIGLAEVMNVNAVLGCDEDMLDKMRIGSRYGVLDGHAPSLGGKALNAYVAAGIDSDHECTTLDEALEKLRLGQYIMIREGTAAHNLEALLPLIDKYCHRCMLVSDDLHPEDLIERGHIDRIVRKAIELGADPVKTLICATLTPALRFGLFDRGAIAPGKRADLAVLDENYMVKDVFCAKRAYICKDRWKKTPLATRKITLSDLCGSEETIELVPGQLLTLDKGCSRKEGDVRLFACERHHGTGHMASCYLRGYGLAEGAVATSIAHDSHNIIAAGDDESIVKAVNKLIETGGGIVVTDGKEIKSLPLEIGGIMSDCSVSEMADRLGEIKRFAYRLGINADIDPFMTLSFLSLPVIPELRLLPTGVIKVK